MATGSPAAARVDYLPEGGPRLPDRLGLRVLLLLGFGGVFILWLLFGYAIADSTVETDNRSAMLRARFLRNEELLSTVRVQALLSSVYVRDALTDPDRSQGDFYRDELSQIRRTIEQAMAEYAPHADVEQADVDRLRRRLREFWDAIEPVLTSARGATPAESRAFLRDEVIPRRETVINISEEIHALNKDAFEAEQKELAEIRGTLHLRIWLTSLTTIGLALVVALLAARAVGRLNARLRDQHRHEVKQTRELARLSTRLLEAQEDERRRIARELHDEIGQALGALKLELAVAERTAAGSSLDVVLAEARSITDRTITTVRDLSQLLHPAMLDHLGLPDTADWYLRAFSRRTGIASELRIERLDERLPHDVEVCTYRVIQEATTNVARHAGATSCRVRIARDPRALRVVVEDNGHGFTPGPPRMTDGHGLGLIGVRERVASLGGSLRVESGAGAGTCLTVDLPLSA
jgi:signal transduction histidine kinase